MPTLRTVHRSPAIPLLLGVTALACDRGIDTPLAPAVTSYAGSGSSLHPRGFEVYTQNVYLGGDTGPLFSLDFSNIPAVVSATSTFWAEVRSSDVPARAAAIVDELDDRRPHVAGLQEVFRFVELDAAFQPVGGIDLLAAIEAEIDARELPYVTQVVQTATSAALPLALGASGITGWLSFTDRLVVLRRTDVELRETAQGLYAARIPLGPLDVVRGWARASVHRDGRTYHLITTHLETQAVPPVQAAQAAELRQAVAAGLDGVTIIAGDLNSNAAGAPGDPTWTPTYGSLIDAGFVDVWQSAPHAGWDEGLTCCHDPTLRGELPFSQRIDFVLVRGSDDESRRWMLARGTMRADVVGEEPEDRSTSGRWPSDHAGLVGSVRTPR